MTDAEKRIVTRVVARIFQGEGAGRLQDRLVRLILDEMSDATLEGFKLTTRDIVSAAVTVAIAARLKGGA